ncbi:hypothetical protein DVH24_037233 [Malus domestica]|uniref:Uncharacterized protein n=1 Tax=Malus domestica TaxID=3750 RepID=A0A498HEK6_MALDO|nr:hypothetical protein DVH24_037233 [Malus domestica]
MAGNRDMQRLRKRFKDTINCQRGSVELRPRLRFKFYCRQSLLGCVWYADGTGRDGTGRNGTERDGTGRNEGVIFEKDMAYICLKMVKHCVPQTWNKPVPGGGGTQKHPKSVPWNSPFHPFLAHQTRDGTPRPVPSCPVPRTKRTLSARYVKTKIMS